MKRFLFAAIAALALTTSCTKEVEVEKIVYKDKIVEDLDRVNALQSQVSSLQSQLNSANSTNTDLESQIESLSAQITNLQSELSSALESAELSDEEILSLEQEIVDLQGEIAALELEVESLTPNTGEVVGQVAVSTATSATHGKITVNPVDFVYDIDTWFPFSDANTQQKTGFSYRLYRVNGCELDQLENESRDTSKEVVYDNLPNGDYLLQIFKSPLNNPSHIGWDTWFPHGDEWGLCSDYQLLTVEGNNVEVSPEIGTYHPVFTATDDFYEIKYDSNRSIYKTTINGETMFLKFLNPKTQIISFRLEQYGELYQITVDMEKDTHYHLELDNGQAKITIQ